MTQTKAGVLAESKDNRSEGDRKEKTQQAISRMKMTGKVVMVMKKASGEVIFEKGK